MNNKETHNNNVFEDELALLQQGIKDGDTASFTRLYSILFKRLYGFSFSIVKVPDLANEVVEDVMLKLWVQRNTIMHIQNLSVYLYIAVKNQSLNKLASKAGQWLTNGFDELTPAMAVINNDPLTMMITQEMLSKINKAVENLPPRCKMIFKLVREDGLKYKEVAEILNISVNTIDVQVALAVKRICLALGVVAKKSTSTLLEKKVSYYIVD